MPQPCADAFSKGTIGCPVPGPEVLNANERPDLLSLHNPEAHIPSMKYLGIMKANGLTLKPSFPVEKYTAGYGSPTEIPKGEYESDVEEGGVFALASRINHHCDSNAHNSWNEDTERYTVHASRDIKAGEEITINYARPFAVPDNR